MPRTRKRLDRTREEVPTAEGRRRAAAAQGGWQRARHSGERGEARHPRPLRSGSKPHPQRGERATHTGPAQAPLRETSRPEARPHHARARGHLPAVSNHSSTDSSTPGCEGNSLERQAGQGRGEEMRRKRCGHHRRDQGRGARGTGMKREGHKQVPEGGRGGWCYQTA